VSELDARGERRAARAIVLGPGEGRTVPGTDGITLKATSEEAAGSVGFLEATTAPGGDRVLRVLMGRRPRGG
jgi:hypothetical protein